jgi:hypothetical protein
MPRDAEARKKDHQEA